MAALTNSRNTPELADGGRLQVYPVEANTTIYLGSMVALNANGNAVPASAEAELHICGRAERVHNGIPGQNAVNNSGASGAISIVVRRGVFMYAVNDSSITAAQVGQLAFAADDNSVTVNDGSAAAQVSAQAITMPAAGTPQVAILGHEAVSKVKVQSTSTGGTVYTEGTDYVIDYQSGLLIAIAGGAITAGSTIYVTYNWGAPTRSVAGRIVNMDPSGQVWIDFWHQS
jgi:VCBS repeat-containing protein